MTVTPPELKAILEQVEAELSAIILAGETGQVTVYIGGHQLQIESNIKRKREPVRIRERGATLIKGIR